MEIACFVLQQWKPLWYGCSSFFICSEEKPDIQVKKMTIIAATKKYFVFISHVTGVRLERAAALLTKLSQACRLKKCLQDGMNKDSDLDVHRICLHYKWKWFSD